MHSSLLQIPAVASPFRTWNWLPSLPTKNSSLAQGGHANVSKRTMWIATDNRASSLAWSTKGSATSTAARAYLMCSNALHQHEHRYVASNARIAGKANVMADNASRLWHFDDAMLLSHSDLNYPQASPWCMLTLTPYISSVLIGTLFRQRPQPECLLNESIPALPGHGSCGWSSVPTSALTPNSSQATPFPFCKSSHSACAPVLLLPVVGLSGLGQWKTLSAPLARRMPAWGPGPSHERPRHPRLSPHVRLPGVGRD